jgi:hypothetical protein
LSRLSLFASTAFFYFHLLATPAPVVVLEG